MRTVACFSALLCAGLVACDSKNAPSPEPSSRAAPQPPPAPSQAALPLARASAAVSAAAPAPSASAAAGPCLPNAKRYDEPKFCVVLPDKTLDISYEGGPEEGSIELEASGDVLRFSWVPVARAGKDSIKAELERVKEGEELAASGELPGGAWSDIKTVGGDGPGKHVVQSLVKTPKLLVNCHFTVEDAEAEPARAVCKSVRAY
jgi:hypothetical protein